MQNSAHGHLFTPVNKIRCPVVLVNVLFALTKPTSTFKHRVVFRHIVGSEKETNLDLDKFKLEEVCTGGACKHCREQLCIRLHLKANKAQSWPSEIAWDSVWHQNETE